MEQISSSIKEKTEPRAETPLKKTYSCSFCSRGFLNAQALGGHMNIHRKDRAKLVMQSLDDESSLDDVPKKNDPVHGDDGHHIHQHAESGRQEKASSPKRPCVTVSREDGPMDQSQLSVASSPLTNREEKQGGSPDMLLEEKKIDELNHGRSFPLELDLELRLGVRP